MSTVNVLLLSVFLYINQSNSFPQNLLTCTWAIMIFSSASDETPWIWVNEFTKTFGRHGWYKALIMAKHPPLMVISNTFSTFLDDWNGSQHFVGYWCQSLREGNMFRTHESDREIAEVHCISLSGCYMPALYSTFSFMMQYRLYHSNYTYTKLALSY